MVQLNVYNSFPKLHAVVREGNNFMKESRKKQNGRKLTLVNWLFMLDNGSLSIVFGLSVRPGEYFPHLTSLVIGQRRNT